MRVPSAKVYLLFIYHILSSPFPVIPGISKRDASFPFSCQSEEVLVSGISQSANTKTPMSSPSICPKWKEDTEIDPELIFYLNRHTTEAPRNTHSSATVPRQGGLLGFVVTWYLFKAQDDQHTPR